MSALPRLLGAEYVRRQLDRLGLEPSIAAGLGVILQSCTRSGRIELHAIERRAVVTTFQRRLRRADQRGEVFPGMRELLSRLEESQGTTVWTAALQHEGRSLSIWFDSSDEMLGCVVSGAGGAPGHEAPHPS